MSFLEMKKRDNAKSRYADFKQNVVVMLGIPDPNNKVVLAIDKTRIKTRSELIEFVKSGRMAHIMGVGIPTLNIIKAALGLPVQETRSKATIYRDQRDLAVELFETITTTKSAKVKTSTHSKFQQLKLEIDGTDVLV